MSLFLMGCEPGAITLMSLRFLYQAPNKWFSMPAKDLKSVCVGGANDKMCLYSKQEGG